jgi:hypothetical protein
VDKRLFALSIDSARPVFRTGKVVGGHSFYQGKTITIVQSTEPGGSGDLRTRAVTERSLNIFQALVIMMQYMPGGRDKAANHMFRLPGRMVSL